tara:strand:+ start:2674 stop:3921 length:1248 start_codon:yes stop_codon:yes gene_type:complete
VLILIGIGVFTLLCGVSLATYFYFKNPEFIVYSYTVLMITNIINKIPNYLVVSNGLLIFCYFLVITFILHFFGKAKKYSFKYVYLVYCSLFLMICLRTFILEIEFFNQTTSLIIILMFYVHLLSSFIDSNKKFENLLYSIIIAQIILFVGVLYNYIFDPASQYQIAAGTIRASTMGLNVNYIASALALNVPVLIYLKIKYINHKSIKLILNTSIVLSIIGILLTLSRAGLVFLVFLFIFYVGKTIKRLAIALFMVSSLIVYIFFISDLPSKYYSIYRFSTLFIFEKNDRTQILGPYFKIIEQNKLSGILLIDDVTRYLDTDEINNFTASHNAYIGLAFNYGIPFMVFYFLPLFLTFRIKLNDSFIKNMITPMVIIILIKGLVAHAYIQLSFFLPFLIASKFNELNNKYTLRGNII